MKEELSKATRTESDLIGEREVPETALYGVSLIYQCTGHYQDGSRYG